MRKKLKEAEAAAKLDPTYKEHVEALKTVIPEDLQPSQIDVKIGHGWIPTGVYEEFIDHLFDVSGSAVKYNAQVGAFAVNARVYPGNAKNDTVWGTSRYSGMAILEDSLHSKLPTVKDKTSDDKLVVNEKKPTICRMRWARRATWAPPHPPLEPWPVWSCRRNSPTRASCTRRRPAPPRLKPWPYSAERLGLWGPGTSFPQKEAFLTEIGGAGLGTMEIVAQNLKAQGTYISRNLSYDGVTYDKIEHKLTKDQQDIYDEMGRAWQVVLKNINAAMQLTGVTGTTNSGNVKTKNGRAKMAVMGKLWGTQLRFYNQVMNALQMPSVLEDMKQKLEAGESVVVQLTNTDEAALGRALDKAGRSEDADLGSIDLTPREDLINYVRASFPVGQFEDYMDDNGNIRSRPVMDSQGNQVENREAVRMREQLIENLQSIRVPESPIDQILNTFGPKNVAEITGREERVLRYTNENGEYVEEHEQRRSDALRRSEVQEFMNDKRQILIFSEKGGTGESYHADLTKKNQRMRNHYLVQAGWRADKAVQGLGRTHRTNQKQPPRYVLCMTNLKGHKRFISTIARRLDQLGALTKGQRQAGSSGLIDAKDNLENRYATRAINQLVHDVFAQQVPDVSMQTLTEKLIKKGIPEKEILHPRRQIRTTARRANPRRAARYEPAARAGSAPRRRMGCSERTSKKRMDGTA